MTTFSGQPKRRLAGASIMAMAALAAQPGRAEEAGDGEPIVVTAAG